MKAYFKEIMKESKSKEVSDKEKHKRNKRRMQNHKSFK
jgi:hypothetical protein